MTSERHSIQKRSVRPVKTPFSRGDFKKTFESLPQVVFQVDNEGKISLINRNGFHLFGFRKADVDKGISIFQALHPDERQKAQSDFVKVNRPTRLQYRAIRQDGHVFPAGIYLSPVRENGLKKGVRGILLDVTFREKIQTHLRESEARYRKRVREIDVFYRIYSHTKMIRRLPDVFYSIAKDITHAFSPDDGIQAKIIFDGKTYAYPRSLKPFLVYREEPLVIAGVNRGAVVIGYNKHPKGGRQMGFLPEEMKLLQNVGQILRKYMYSREIIERHKKIVQKSFSGIFIVKDNLLVYTNSRFGRLLKLSEEEIIGKPLTHFVLGHPKIATLLDGHHRECKAERKDGTMIDVNISMQPMYYHGDKVGLGWMRDVTPLKKAEERLQAFNVKLKKLVAEKTRHLQRANQRLQSLNELKDDFIATTSHELRSPLTSVRGYLSFLMEKKSLERIPEDLRPYMVKVHNNTETLNRLINNILDVSRLSTGRFPLRIQMVDFVSLTQNMIENLSFQAEEKKIKITLNTSLKTLPISIDVIRISQVLRNLLDNAIKFSPEGKRITFTLAKTPTHAVLSIMDQGPGIPAKQLPHIFGKFNQGKNRHTRYSGGAGLGLFITKSIVELHRGKIEAESMPRKGAVFTLRLPLHLKK